MLIYKAISISSFNASIIGSLSVVFIAIIFLTACSSNTDITRLDYENIDVNYVEPISESEARKLAEYMFGYIGGASSGGSSVHLSVAERQETIYEVRFKGLEGIQLDILRSFAVHLACSLESDVFVGKQVDVIFVEDKGQPVTEWVDSNIVFREMCW